jgi:hypothetical protein
MVAAWSSNAERGSPEGGLAHLALLNASSSGSNFEIILQVDVPTERELKLPLLYFHHLQNRSGKINVHAMHVAHALPDLRVVRER